MTSGDRNGGRLYELKRQDTGFYRGFVIENDGEGHPVLSKQRVPAIEPGLNGLHQQEVGHGKKRDRTQQPHTGSGINPRRPPSGVYGNTTATVTTTNTPISSGRLGRLLSGLPAVRITNTTSVCVARDSTNHPVRKSVALAEAWNTQSNTPKVRKS